jgi:hypothetical protein
VHAEGAFEQVVQFLGDLGVEARIRVFEHDVLLRVAQRAGIQRAAGAGGGEGVDVGPFVRRGPRRRVGPFLLQRAVEGFVGEEVEELRGLLVVLPGVLGDEDVGLEMLAENAEAPSGIWLERDLLGRGARQIRTLDGDVAVFWR